MSLPSYIEVMSGSPRVRDYARGVREGGCPSCGHDSLVVKDAIPADRYDPACWTGYCECGRSAPSCGPCERCTDDHDPKATDIPVTDATCECDCHCRCTFET